MTTKIHQEWLGKLPENWNRVSIRDLGDIYSGSTPSRNREEYWNGSVAWVTPGEITELHQKWLLETREYISEAGYKNSSTHLLPEGTILVTTRATIGYIALAGIPVTTNQGFKSIVPNKSTDPSFYFHMLKQLAPEMDRLASGSTFKEISGKNFAGIIVPRPEQDEQALIAAILDTIDDAIRYTKLLIEKLKQIRAGLMHDLLTYGIDENGDLRDPKRNPDQFTESKLGIIPNTWSIKSLEGVSTRLTDGTHEGAKSSPDGTIPFLYVSCIRDERIYWEYAGSITEDVYERISKGREPQKDLILYTVVGSYGYAAIVEDDRKFSFQRHIAYISPDQDKVSPQFLEAWLNSDYCRAYADRVALGNAQKTITLGELEKYPVPVPPFIEQKLIADVLVRSRDSIFSEQHHLEKLQLLKQGLMDDLLTGQVRVLDLLGKKD